MRDELYELIHLSIVCHICLVDLLVDGDVNDVFDEDVLVVPIDDACNHMPNR